MVSLRLTLEFMGSLPIVYGDFLFAIVMSIVSAFLVLRDLRTALYNSMPDMIIKLISMFPGYTVGNLAERLKDENIFPNYGEWTKKAQIKSEWPMYEATIYGLAYLCNMSYKNKTIVPPFIGKFKMALASPDGKWVTRQHIFDPPQNAWRSRTINYYHSNVIVHTPPTVFMLHEYTNVYGHFLIELFPKFWHAYQQDKGLVALLTNCDTFMIDQVFDYFGIPRDNYRCVSNDRPVFVAELYMSPPRGMPALDLEAVWAGCLTEISVCEI